MRCSGNPNSAQKLVMLAAGLALASCSTLPQNQTGVPVEVAVVSDIPYTKAQAYNFGKASEAIAEAGFPFIAHLGDYKSGDTPCNDETRNAHAAWMAGFGETPVYYTPGDNDWTDCDREGAGAPIPELGELDKLRAAAFGAPHPNEARFATERQEGYPENAIWAHGGVLFVTLHVVATNNGRAEILLDDEAVALARVEGRDAANDNWLERAFTRARAMNAAAIVIFQQADPYAGDGDTPCDANEQVACNGLIGPTKAVQTRAARFNGPVLLAHGDTGPYCMDRGFGGDSATNLWRFNAAGDYVLIDPVKLIIDPVNRAEPFRAESILHRIPPAKGC